MTTNLYKDFLHAVQQHAEVSTCLITELRYSSEKLEASCKQMVDTLKFQQKHLTYLDQRFERLNILFTKLSAANDKD